MKKSRFTEEQIIFALKRAGIFRPATMPVKTGQLVRSQLVPVLLCCSRRQRTVRSLHAVSTMVIVTYTSLFVALS